MGKNIVNVYKMEILRRAKLFEYFFPKSQFPLLERFPKNRKSIFPNRYLRSSWCSSAIVKLDPRQSITYSIAPLTWFLNVTTYRTPLVMQTLTSKLQFKATLVLEHKIFVCQNNFSKPIKIWLHAKHVNTWQGFSSSARKFDLLFEP